MKKITVLALAAFFSMSAQAKNLKEIDHIVVLYLENRSFDNLFGLFPSSNGLENAKNVPLQIDEFGRNYATLPPISDNRFPDNLPNQPFDIARYVPITEKHLDLTHRFFIHQMQINGGKNDRFAQLSSAGSLTMGHYDLSQTALWQYAKEFTLADNFFQAAYGGSFLNHQWLICACTPEFKNASEELKVWKIDKNTGKITKDPTVTQDDYAVNSLQPHYAPYDLKHDEKRLPPQTHATIGDRLSEKGISWAWYSGGWNDAVANKDTGENFQFHHQPFVYYENFAPDTQARKAHLKDKTQLFEDLKSIFPSVAFFKPAGSKNQHPGYATILDADAEVKEIVEAIRQSPIWEKTAIVITYDEYGGFWDHVAPPQIDRWGAGTRIPAIIISPFAKKGFVDNTLYNTTSILKLIENRFDLKALSERDAKANGLEGAFAF
jgi:phospholipase C